MNLKEKILEKCNKKIEIMERAECPKWIKEKTIRERRASKEILEIVCGIQGITIVDIKSTAVVFKNFK